MTASHWLAAYTFLAGTACLVSAQGDVTWCAAPHGGSAAPHYVGNRAPLVAEPLIRLPIGAIEPRGWLHTQLRLNAEGMVGHLEELSPWCRFDGSAWASPTGEGANPWEEMPYWLKGYTDLAYVLKDDKHIGAARRWLDAILASQRPDGYFGPEANRATPDLWPNMLALAALRSLHEATGDARVVPFMERYFRWQAQLPEGRFLHESWQHMRGADNLEIILWLYNRTGAQWLLDLAGRNHRCTARWSETIASAHGVNFAQGFREPGQFYQRSRDPKHLRAVESRYGAFRVAYGQVPGGMYGADENARPGYTGPRQGTETCAFVEMMYSHQEMVRITGDTLWADRCEDVALNSFPPSLSPDQKALHYLTCPNQVQLDRANKAPMIQNGGDMMSYTPYEQYRCCQHNVAFGWPYYAGRLWMATRDRGLAAVLYAPCEVRARVAGGQEVLLTQTTDYPFDDRVSVRISSSVPVAFAVYLRVPGWCAGPRLAVNGRRMGTRAPARGSRWLRLYRTWKDGDTIELRLPMIVRVDVWRANRGAVSVSRGPLTYSLRVPEEWREYRTGRDWKAFEVFPRGPWNYGLSVDVRAASRTITVARTRMPGSGEQPFDLENAPIVLRAKGVRVPEWTLEQNGLIGEVAPGPIASERSPETVELVPMGCARLRVTAFPLMASASVGRKWHAPGAEHGASWTNPSDSLAALTDGLAPRSSADVAIPRFTWWDHVGSREWVQWNFGRERSLRRCEVYWFDDEALGGRCRLPASFQVLRLDGDRWVPVKARPSGPVRRDGFSVVEFEAVRTRALRIEAQLAPGFSAGILEWRAR